MLFLLATVEWNILVPILLAFFGPVFAYLAAARRLSGRIATSEAADLWEESSSLRAEYKEEVTELKLLITKLRGRVEDLEDKNEALYLENGALREEVIKLRHENRVLKARIDELERMELGK